VIRWMTAAEAVSSAANSASGYDFVKNIRVVPIVEPERELVEVERQIFFRYVVEVADDPAFPIIWLAL
jgi:hypothetical protein